MRSAQTHTYWSFVELLCPQERFINPANLTDTCEFWTGRGTLLSYTLQENGNGIELAINFIWLDGRQLTSSLALRWLFDGFLALHYFLSASSYFQYYSASLSPVTGREKPELRQQASHGSERAGSTFRHRLLDSTRHASDSMRQLHSEHPLAPTGSQATKGHEQQRSLHRCQHHEKQQHGQQDCFQVFFLHACMK